MRAFFPMLLLLASVVSLSCTADYSTVPNEPWPVATLSVEPTSAVVPVGTAIQLSAIARDPGGAPFYGLPIAWTTSNGSIATVGVDGILNGLAAGSVDITAIVEGKSATATITVTSIPVGALATVTVTPAQYTFTAVAESVQFSATAQDALGAPVTGIRFAWASTNSSVATVDSLGKVTAKAAGAASIIVSAPSLAAADTAPVVVQTPPLPIPPGPAITWLWETGLEADNPFNTSFTHPGGSVTRTTEWPHSGTYSLKFTTPAQIYQRASVVKSFAFEEKIQAVDLWFFLPAGQSDLGFEVAIEGWSGSEQHLSSFQWRKDAAFGLLGWQRWVGNTWAYLPGGAGVLLSEEAWHHLHLEVDYEKKEYGKLVIDGLEFGLQGLPYDVTPQVAARNLSISILLWTSTPQSVSAFVDDVRVGEVQRSN